MNRADTLRAVQRYQVARMRSTHEALFASPTYRPLCEFFLTDLYGPREIGASRAAAMRSLVEAMRFLVPRWIYDGSVGLVELHSLSERLDDRLARQILSAGGAPELDVGVFESAYFRCDDRDDRLRQIALSAAATRFGHALTGHHSVDRLLWAAHRLPGLPSLGPLLTMFDRGLHAFRLAREIEPFIERMRAGETGYLDGVYFRQRG